MAKRWRLWLGLVISLAFVYLAVRQVNNPGQVLAAARGANYWLVLPALAVYFIGVWVRSMRWHYLLKPVKSISANRLFPAVVIGYMANDILPFRIGELVRAYVLGEMEKVSKTTTFATIVVERLMDGVTMLLFLGVISMLAPLPGGSEFVQQVIRYASILFVGGMLVIVVVTSSRRLTLKVLDIVLRFAPQKLRPAIADKADAFLEGFAATQSPWAMGTVLGLSILAWLLEAGMYYLLAIAFGLGLPPYVLALTTAVANLAAMVPSSPGYVGTFDAACLLVLGAYGINSNLAFSYTVVLHAVLLVPITLWGFYYLWRYNLSLGQARQLPREAELT